MKHLLNTLFVLTEDSYLALDGENIIIMQNDNLLGRFPLHTLECILYFGYKGASPALMGACAKRNISICFLTPNGHFLARVCGETRGNLLLRKEQYRISDNELLSCSYARNFIVGKVFNARWVLERATRDHAMRLDVMQIKKVSQKLADSLIPISQCKDLSALRGLEGETAMCYFGIFDDLILQNKQYFYFHERSRHPPLDNLNALLSFGYTLLAHDCASALECVGLDPYVGFLHRDRPGRESLALDLMEELRVIFVDRFVLTLINNKIILPKHMITKENGAVILTDEGRKIFLNAWQNRKKEIITHPFLNEKIPWGLVPYTQALLLARCIRGDIDCYPPFFWK